MMDRHRWDKTADGRLYHAQYNAEIRNTAFAPHPPVKVTHCGACMRFFKREAMRRKRATVPRKGGHDDDTIRTHWEAKAVRTIGPVNEKTATAGIVCGRVL